MYDYRTLVETLPGSLQDLAMDTLSYITAQPPGLPAFMCTLCGSCTGVGWVMREKEVTYLRHVRIVLIVAQKHVRRMYPDIHPPLECLGECRG